MKTTESIESQEARKEAGRNSTHNSGPVTGKRRGRIENLKPWPKGVSANPGGRPQPDIAAKIAKAVFEQNAEALYQAYTRALMKGNAYAFKELADRAYGKVKERIEHEVRPYQDIHPKGSWCVRSSVEGPKTASFGVGVFVLNEITSKFSTRKYPQGGKTSRVGAHCRHGYLLIRRRCAILPV